MVPLGPTIVLLKREVYTLRWDGNSVIEEEVEEVIVPQQPNSAIAQTQEGKIEATTEKSAQVFSKTERLAVPPASLEKSEDRPLVEEVIVPQYSNSTIAQTQKKKIEETAKKSAQISIKIKRSGLPSTTSKKSKDRLISSHSKKKAAK